MLQSLKSMETITGLLNGLNILTYSKPVEVDLVGTQKFVAAHKGWTEKDFVSYFKRHLPNDKLVNDNPVVPKEINDRVLDWFIKQSKWSKHDDDLYQSLTNLDDLSIVMNYLIEDKKRT